MPQTPANTTPITDWECFSSEDHDCSRYRCFQNPSIGICDVLTEADNAQCSDGVDNDGDGYVDCRDFNCTKNPFVTVCHERDPLMQLNLREVSAEACSDGVDNDFDDLIDCEDPGCQVRQLCGGSPGNPLLETTGMEESTTASCRNGWDDDLDGEADCRDRECATNPLVDVCGSERSLEQCVDGLDNDGDGYVDCRDPHCYNNPFFNDYLCRDKVRTGHEMQLSAYACNGVYHDSDALMSMESGKGGRPGRAGDMLRVIRAVTVNIQPCEFWDEPCLYEEFRPCNIGKSSVRGERGPAGTAGSFDIKWTARRQVDTLRTLLSPRQWVVETANGNLFYKQGDWNTASFTYLHNIMRIHGVLAEMEVDCEADVSTLNYTQSYLLATLCPTLQRNEEKLSYLHAGLNFFGLPKDPPHNPRNRYAELRSRFDTLFGALDSNIRN